MTASLQLPVKIPFENVDSQSVPAFGVMQVTGSTVENGVTFLTCAQVGSALGSEFAVNGPSVVRSGDKGICFRQGDLQVAYDDGSPQPGEGWGVRAGQWTLSKGYPSIVAVHGVQNAANHILYGKLTTLTSVLGVSSSDLAPQSGGQPGTGTLGVSVWDGEQFSPAEPAMSFTGYNTAVTPVKAGVLTRFVASNGILIAATPENYVYHVQLDNSISAGGSATITLPDGRGVTVTNWSGTDYNSGDKVTVYEDLTNGSFYAIKSGAGAVIVRFELTADLVYGADPGSPNAEILTWQSGAYSTAGNYAITVYDWTNDSGLGTWSGKGPNSSPAKSGYQGLAIKQGDSNRYEIVWMESKAQLIAFRLYQQLTTGMSSVGNCVVTAFWNGRDPDPASANITVYNLATDYSGVFKFSGDANALGYAVWNEKTGVYKIIALEGDGRRWVVFKNLSGYTVPAKGVMAQQGVTQDAGGHTNTRNVITTARPDTTFRRDYWVNGLADVANNTFGVCGSSESPMEALYDSGTPATGEGWGPKPGQFTLSKGFPGFTIVGITDSFNKAALVKQEPILQLLVKTTAAINTNASTTYYKIYTGAQGSEADGGWTSVPTAYNRSGFIDTGAWAFLKWLNNGWELVPRPETLFLAKLTSSLSQGSSASATIYAGTPNAETSTGIGITVYDWLMKSGATAIAVNKKVICKYVNGNAYVIDAECN